MSNLHVQILEILIQVDRFWGGKYSSNYNLTYHAFTLRCDAMPSSKVFIFFFIKFFWHLPLLK